MDEALYGALHLTKPPAHSTLGSHIGSTIQYAFLLGGTKPVACDLESFFLKAQHQGEAYSSTPSKPLKKSCLLSNIMSLARPPSPVFAGLPPVFPPPKRVLASPVYRLRSQWLSS